MDHADIIIVGGGFTGTAACASLADGRRKMVLLEAKKNEASRFSGELIHPDDPELAYEKFEKTRNKIPASVHREAAARLRGIRCCYTAKRFAADNWNRRCHIPCYSGTGETPF